MTVIFKSDLETANSSEMITILTNDQEDSEDLKKSISGFISSSPAELQGDGYDAIRGHLEKYISLLELRIKAAEGLKEAIKAANNQMSSFMEDESKIDTNELAGLRAQRASKSSQLDSVRYSISSFNYQTQSRDLLSSYYSRESSLKKEIEELDKKIERREQLPSKDNSAFAEIEAAAVDLTTYANEAGSFEVIRINNGKIEGTGTDIIPTSTVSTDNTNTVVGSGNASGYNVAATKTDLNTFMNHVTNDQVAETKNYAKYNDHCLGFAYTHAYGLYNGDTSVTAEDGYNYAHAGYFKTYDSDDKQEIVTKVYDEVTSGKPCILQVNGNKEGTSRHFVTVVGVKDGATESTVKETDLLIIDSYDGKLETMNGKGSGTRFMTSGKDCNKPDYSGYRMAYIK